MSKNKKLGYAILGVVFVLFNVIVFSLPTDRTSVFWITYAFTVFAFAVQIFVWNWAFGKSETLKSKFLGLPIIHIGTVYLIIQLIAFGVFLAVPGTANWVPIIVCTLIAGISGIFLIATEVGREEISRVKEKVQQKVSTIKSLQVEVDLIAEAQTDTETKEALEALAEKIKYSDPMSDESLSPIEDEIGEKIATLKTIPTTNILSSVKQIEILLLERNKKSKLLK